MAIYATVELLTEYVQDNGQVEVPDDAAAERLLERAERDLDHFCAMRGGFDLDALSEAQKAALARGVCAQCEWRLLVGEPALAGDESGVTSVAGIGLDPRWPSPVGPKVAREIGGHGLIAYSGTVAA